MWFMTTRMISILAFSMKKNLLNFGWFPEVVSFDLICRWDIADFPISSYVHVLYITVICVFVNNRNDLHRVNHVSFRETQTLLVHLLTVRCRRCLSDWSLSWRLFHRIYFMIARLNFIFRLGFRLPAIQRSRRSFRLLRNLYRARLRFTISLKCHRTELRNTIRAETWN